ncbi:MarR family transcriptional regulator [Actinomadura sp. ATCC 31491]|uniref:MarR family transcriptional regulator n=1 Tax=Actinomadura luzonensis TaxID=2805427 RepID=A0ABT0FZU8_9ACTN|nr:MarR family transcriptional regulator [Actinomadura luzonensis]MCK2217822.1 MarR family transcriptional regulator [Actinomadura luzonensis]
MTPTPGAADRISSLTGYQLLRLGELVQRRVEGELARWGLTGKELRVLAYAHDAPRSQRGLAAVSRMDRTTMTAVVNKLESLGYVRRERDAGDRRKYVVAVTGEGARTVEAALARLAEAERAFLGPLTPVERSLLANMTARLVAGQESAESENLRAPQEYS